MGEFESVKDMRLGELVLSLINLKEEWQEKLVDSECPYPENYDKHGGVAAYNAQLNAKYQKRQEELVVELNVREQYFKD